MTTLPTPGPTVGVVGGGQLGRMLGEAASPLGIELHVLDPTPKCPASIVARDQIVESFDDVDAITTLAERSDVLTFEIELADQTALAEVSGSTNTPVHPHPETLEMIHDKLVQKRRLAEQGIPVPDFRPVSHPEDIEEALTEFGSPVMLKARTGGYDGRGNVPVADTDDIEAASGAIVGPTMVERFVDFTREISVIGVKGDGEVRTYTPSENIHQEEILRTSITPARAPEAVLDRATSIAHDVLSVMNGRGVYGIELFERTDGTILVNEIAPRPHNTGHWTIEGAAVSQFENHLRAVLGWPLGSTETRGRTVVTNILGDGGDVRSARLEHLDTVLTNADAHLHWYGKREVRPLRKMGHITLTGSADRDPSALLEAVTDLRETLAFS